MHSPVESIPLPAQTQALYSGEHQRGGDSPAQSIALSSILSAFSHSSVAQSSMQRMARVLLYKHALMAVRYLNALFSSAVPVSRLAPSIARHPLSSLHSPHRVG